jgi:hypothetical protein
MEIRRSRKERVAAQDERALQHYPVVAPAIRIWLRENCQLVEFTELEDAVKPISVPHHSGTELDKLQALDRAAIGSISPNISQRFR